MDHLLWTFLKGRGELHLEGFIHCNLIFLLCVVITGFLTYEVYLVIQGF